MNNRERLLAVLDGKPVDRVPIWLLFPYHKAGYYTDVRTNPRYRSIFEQSKEYAIMLNRRNARVPIYPAVQIETETLVEGNNQVTRDHWRYKNIHLFSEVSKGQGVTRVKKLLNSDEDLEKLAEIPVDTDKQSVDRWLDTWLPTYLQEKLEFPLGYGAMMLDLGEPISFLYSQSNLEDFAIWSITNNDLVIAQLDKYMAHKRLVYQYCLERDLADVYFMVGSELASPPMVSRSTFQQWIVPYGKELVDLVHSYGKKVIMHYHGQIKEILPDFVTMGPDALHTIEAPPIGNCTLPEAFSVVGDTMTLIGNVQYDCFRSYTKAEMAEEVKTIIDECRGKRLILSPTAGPYDDNISDTIVENYLTFLETGWHYGRG